MSFCILSIEFRGTYRAALATFSSYDRTLIQVALGALGLFLVASIGYFFIRLALKRLVKKMPGLVDDRILVLSDRFLLPLVVLLLTYASFMSLPLSNAYSKIGSQALFVVIVFFGAWFLSPGLRVYSWACRTKKSLA